MGRDLESIFPGLRGGGYRVTSPKTPNYNCIAWAASQEDRWWWPDEAAYWPSNVPRIATIEAFVAAFGTLGYEPCGDRGIEPGYEKVVIYAKDQGMPTHAARQLPDGRWTSKLGKLEDIVHAAIEHLHGSDYGQAAVFLKRPVPDHGT